MARRMTGGVAIVTLALALLLAPSVSEAQGQKGKRAGNPGEAIPAPPSVLSGPRRKAAPKPPDDYFNQGGPAIAPQGQAGAGQVANSLRARGFNSIGPVQQRGNTLITEAVDPNGTRVQLVVTPNGQIIGIRPLGPRSR